MYYPSLQNMKRHEIKRFNEIKELLKKGKIPAGMVNPMIIKEHNEVSPEVCKIDHGNQELSLDALALLYISYGVSTRKHWRDTVFSKEPTKVESIEDLDFSTMSRKERHAEMEFNDE